MAAIEDDLSLLMLPGGAPLFRPAAPLRHRADRARGAVGVFRGTAGWCPRPHRCPSPDARRRFAQRGSGMVRALRDGIVVRALPRRSDGDGMDRTLPAPSRLPDRGSPRRRGSADDGALRDRVGADWRGVSPPPRTGAAARRPRSTARLDVADAGGRTLRPASPRPPRYPF